MNSKLAKGAAALGAVAVLAFGAAAISGANAGSSGASSTRPGGAGAGFGGTAGQGQIPQEGQFRGGGAGGAPPGLGSPVTGATADKVAKAAVAKYPGQVEQVQKLPDGSYVAHVFTSSGEVHVAVSATFKVTGKAAGMRGPGSAGGAGRPGGQGQPPAGAGSSTSPGSTI
ncbi:MAG: hypothetical protein QOE86_2569 [Solirubrobacteraceae bacterium]|nr:hypothetical protein [Solirubrobacteraceae bacterium]